MLCWIIAWWFGVVNRLPGGVFYLLVPGEVVQPSHPSERGVVGVCDIAHLDMRRIGRHVAGDFGQGQT